MSSRRARITIKAERPEDAAVLLDQIPDLLKDRNVEVQIKSPASASGTVPPEASDAERATTSADEQLETSVHETARGTLAARNRAAEEDRAARGVSPESREAEAPEAVIARRSGLLGKVGDWVKAGFGFTVQKAAQGVTDSALNK